MVKFKDNSEGIFLVISKSKNSESPPKLAKAIEQMFFCPEEAFKACDSVNNELDPSGKVKFFNVFEVMASIRNQWDSLEEYEKASS